MLTENQKQISKAYYWRNRTLCRQRTRRSDLKRGFGMTMGEYTALVERTKGRCAVCSKIPARRLDIDHSPRTGLVRGLLCSPCNLAVGHLDRVGVSAFAAYMALNDW